MKEPRARVLKLSGRLRTLAVFLSERRGKFVSRQELLVEVFKHPPTSPSRTVDTHIQWLLSLLGDTEEILYIRSRRRHGYMLAPQPGGPL